MTKMLQEVLKTLSQLPESRQDELARMLMDLVGDELHPQPFVRQFIVARDPYVVSYRIERTVGKLAVEQ